MAAQPPRRTTPVPHLLPQVVPVEKALRARADAIEHDDLIVSANIPAEVVTAVQVILAAEFRALADELHYWD